MPQESPARPPSIDYASAPPPQAPSSAEERFEYWRKRGGLILLPVACAAAVFLARDLSREAVALAGILAVVCVLWVSELLPLPVTALLGAAACIVLGVAPARRVLGFFADPIVFVFIGSFMLARAMMIHRLDRRIALSFLSLGWIAASPARVLAGLGLVTALVSMWVSNTATTAMMLPIALGVLGAIRRGGATPDAHHGRFATGMMLMVAYAASVGGIGTPVGSPPNLIGIGLIRGATGVEIGFFRWMALCVPLLAAMGAALFVLLYKLHPAGPQEHGGAPLRDYLEDERVALGPISRGQVNTLVAFGVAVSLWILPGIVALPLWGEPGRAWTTWLNDRLPESVVALAAALLLFALPVDLKRGEFTLTWDQAVQIDWGTILLFGGGLALGTLMFDTGVARALGEALTGAAGVQSVWALTAAAILLGIVLSEATSNTASANMVIPVVIGIAQ